MTGCEAACSRPDLLKHSHSSAGKVTEVLHYLFLACLSHITHVTLLMLDHPFASHDERLEGTYCHTTYTILSSHTLVWSHTLFMSHITHVTQVERLEDPVAAVSEILSRVPAKQLMSLYKVATFDGVDAFLQQVASARGKLKRGGIVDVEVSS